ncbi:MAG: hypothetical protein CSH37_08040 [Thalassolituus sp.]|jgi:long-subunit fatty acid transport protein|nr:hypothetical protein [Pseudomonadales bacterium]TNC85355.1 MAG: hypothetical protein CSH37_08040 [Thalassolituus sp.]HAG95444.1 hypothetical protein [Gammaproteobacteria bacterium]|tara:strand:- start:8534 stop:10132 length:1599 start_codon:yes stop_codon:yes gene_type:complete
MRKELIVTFLVLICVTSGAQAQLSQNLSIGNPIALSLGNSITAYPPGTDAIHYNPAGLALIKNKYEQYKLQTAFFRYEGSVSGQSPGVPFAPSNSPAYRQDPILQGETSRPVEVDSVSVYLPFFGHVELPFLMAPGYGFATRFKDRDFVFANSALTLQAFGYTRDEDNIGAFNGQQFGITRIAYFNPTIAMNLSDDLLIGGSIGFSWQGLGIKNRTRAVLHSLGEIDELLEELDPEGALGLDLSPYTDVGTLEVDVQDPLSLTFTLGMLWQPSPWFSWGLTYQSPGQTKMRGDFRISYTDDFNATMLRLKPAQNLLALLDGGPISGDKEQTGKVELEYTQPQWIATGISLLMMPQLRINLDVKWIDYSVTEQLEFQFDRNLDYLTLSSVVNHLFRRNVGSDYSDPDILRLPREFQDVTDWSVGIEYYYNDTLTLRAGYEPRSSVIPGNRQDLLIPIGEADLYGLGVGYRVDAHSQLDVALGYLVSKIDIKPGESRSSTSTIEGDSVYNPFRGMHVKHQLEAYIFTLAYSKHF